MAFKQKYEVAVIGGGVAGVAAALAAARRGHKVVLIEKGTILGGLATSGLICVYLAICDGFGHQVGYSLTEELLLLGSKYGPENIPPYWKGDKSADPKQRYVCVYAPSAMSLALDEELNKAGVDIYYDTMLLRAFTDDQKRLQAVEVVNADGFSLLEAEIFVDASGSCSAIRQAGGEVEMGGNFQILWTLMNYPKEMQGDFPINIKYFGPSHPPVPPFASVTAAGTNKLIHDGFDEVRAFLNQEYSNGKSRQELFPTNLPTMPLFRKVARIMGRATLDSEQHGLLREDSVGLAADWRRKGPIWEIPYGALLPEKLTGVLAAGRCVASTNDAWDVMRVIPPAVTTGESAGVAAALAVEKGVLPHELDIKLLQNELRKLSIPLHIPDIGLTYNEVLTNSQLPNAQ